MSQRQTQRSGDHSQQIQVQGDLIVHPGLSEQRAMEIAESTARSVIAEYTAEANEVAFQRISRFDERVVEELSGSGHIGAFADPAFQVLLRKAQIGAASTEREVDYDVLARLLQDRVSQGGHRPTRAGIDRAVQIVDQVDHEALTGLTVLMVVFDIAPTSGKVSIGLDVMENVFGTLLECDLPRGGEWLDHLDILDAVRISHLGRIKRFDEGFPAKMPGYLAAGVEANSEAELEAVAELDELAVSIPIVDHELKPGYRRISVVDVGALDSVLTDAGIASSRAEAVKDIASTTFGVGVIDGGLRVGFMDQVRCRPNLRLVADWWDTLDMSIQLTAVGRALARANAKRCDSIGMLPDFM